MIFGNEALVTLQQAILNRDFFPDVPDPRLAYEQMRVCFGHSAQACKFVCELLYAKHEDKWAYEAICWTEQQFPSEIYFAHARAWLLHYRLNSYQEAEAAYRQAIALDEKFAYPVANLARLLWQQNRTTEATDLFKKAADLSQPDEQEVFLQAHLVLGNKQLAIDAVMALAQLAQQGKSKAFYRLKEQVWECNELGLGELLADWMRESPDALFLQPFVQALYTLAGTKHKLQDLPQEVQQMADEVVRLSLGRVKG